jgi:hypothetical protein
METFKERRAALVAALRSGEFTQATGCLRDTTEVDGKPTCSYCCLGVACELYRRTTGAGEWIFDEFRCLTGKYSETLPAEVQDWYGFKDSIGGAREIRTEIDSLAELNDSGGAFPEIANILEVEPEGMFDVAVNPTPAPPSKVWPDGALKTVPPTTPSELWPRWVVTGRYARAREDTATIELAETQANAEDAFAQSILDDDYTADWRLRENREEVPVLINTVVKIPREGKPVIVRAPFN